MPSILASSPSIARTINAMYSNGAPVIECTITSGGIAVCESQNTIRATLIDVLYKISINKCILTVNGTLGAAGTKVYVGIYDSTGKKLQQWSFAADTAAIQTTLGSLSLIPGQYYICTGFDGASTVPTISSFAMGLGPTFINNARQYLANTGNHISAGVMPSTLGTLTTSSNRGLNVFLFSN